VAGVAFSSGGLAATAESDTINHVVIVQTFSKGGYFRHTLLTTDPGYAQPVLASDGTNLYLVMVKVSDMSVVARKWNGSMWTVDKPLISSSDCGANCSWPNAIRGTDGRLRLVVGGPEGSDTEGAVLAFQRRLSVLFP